VLESLTSEDFAARVGETFTAAGDGGTLNLTLVAVDLLPTPPEHRQQFSLELRDDAHLHLPQQTFSVEHAELGTFDLFMVPVGRDAEGIRYQAIFA
jgi:hypothetical protein